MTVNEIKKTMTDAFIADPAVIAKYGLEAGKSFEEQFSAVSLESLIFFIVATALWLFGYKMLAQHKADVNAALAENKAHRPEWYAAMARKFQFGHPLAADTDGYDNSGRTEQEVAAARVVKFAAVWQPRDKSILYLKVAGEDGGRKKPLTAGQLTAFKNYLNDISDAGVRIEVINAPGDDMRLEIDIYYDALVLDASGSRLDGTGATPVQDAVREYLGGLSFNGLYTDQSLVDRLQQVAGVEQAELVAVAARYGTYTEFQRINARGIPHAGYYSVTDNNLIIRYIPNEEYL